MNMNCLNPVALLAHIARLPVGYFPQEDGVWAFHAGGKACLVFPDKGDTVVIELPTLRRAN